MQVNKVTLNTPTFQAKIPTKELIGFICKASTTDNKFASSAATVTKLSRPAHTCYGYVENLLRYVGKNQNKIP